MARYQQSEPITRMQFRMIDGEVIAIMPDVPGTSEYDFLCYVHMGQHSSAGLHLTSKGRLAKPEEYARLKSELESIGYRIQVIKRVNRDKAMKARRSEMAVSQERSERMNKEVS